jgi:hypothetical protein
MLDFKCRVRPASFEILKAIKNGVPDTRKEANIIRTKFTEVIARTCCPGMQTISICEKYPRRSKETLNSHCHNFHLVAEKIERLPASNRK